MAPSGKLLWETFRPPQHGFYKPSMRLSVRGLERLTHNEFLCILVVLGILGLLGDI